MRKGISYKSQTTFGCITMSFREKLICRERWEIQTSTPGSIMKSVLSSHGSAMSHFTSPWGTLLGSLVTTGSLTLWQLSACSLQVQKECTQICPERV